MSDKELASRYPIDFPSHLKNKGFVIFFLLDAVNELISTPLAVLLSHANHISPGNLVFQYGLFQIQGRFE